MSTEQVATFAAVGLTLYAAHHVGDYWVQRDEDARYKGDPGWVGRVHCLVHVITYVMTQTFFLIILVAGTGVRISSLGLLAGLAVSGVTHYIADRREPLKRLARLIPGKAKFLELGVPAPDEIYAIDPVGMSRRKVDNPQLATGLWALDQAWHIFWGVWVAALLIAGLS